MKKHALNIIVHNFPKVSSKSLLLIVGYSLRLCAGRSLSADYTVSVLGWLSMKYQVTYSELVTYLLVSVYVVSLWTGALLALSLCWLTLYVG